MSDKQKNKYNHYTEEFRREAVRRSDESGITATDVARELGIHPGGTTEDYQFSLEKVACFGSCALAPVMVVDKKVYGRMTTVKAREVLPEY